MQRFLALVDGGGSGFLTARFLFNIFVGLGFLAIGAVVPASAPLIPLLITATVLGVIIGVLKVYRYHQNKKLERDNRFLDQIQARAEFLEKELALLTDQENFLVYELEKMEYPDSKYPVDQRGKNGVPEKLVLDNKPKQKLKLDKLASAVEISAATLKSEEETSKPVNPISSSASPNPFPTIIGSPSSDPVMPKEVKPTDSQRPASAPPSSAASTTAAETAPAVKPDEKPQGGSNNREEGRDTPEPISNCGSTNILDTVSSDKISSFEFEGGVQAKKGDNTKETQQPTGISATPSPAPSEPSSGTGSAFSSTSSFFPSPPTPANVPPPSPCNLGSRVEGNIPTTAPATPPLTEEHANTQPGL
jgi:hypothetical protein